MPIARQPVAKHIRAETNAQNNRTSLARQRRSKQALSTIQDLFSVGPPRYYIRGTEQNQASRRTRMRMEQVLDSQGKSVRLKIDCEFLQL
jgi:hypothetical protein